MRRRFYILALALALFTGPLYAEPPATPEAASVAPAPLVQFLKRLLINEHHRVDVATPPTEWTQTWWNENRGSYSDAEWKLAFEALEKKYPTEIAKARTDGKKYRETFLGELDTYTKERWTSDKVPVALAADLSRSVEALIAAKQKSNRDPRQKLLESRQGETKRSRFQIEIETGIRLREHPLGRSTPQEQWKEDKNIGRTGFRIGTAVEEETIPGKQMPKVSRENFVIWKAAREKALADAKVEIGRAYLAEVLRTFPDAFVYYHESNDKGGIDQHRITLANLASVPLASFEYAPIRYKSPEGKTSDILMRIGDTKIDLTRMPGRASFDFPSHPVFAPRSAEVDAPMHYLETLKELHRRSETLAEAFSQQIYYTPDPQKLRRQVADLQNVYSSDYDSVSQKTTFKLPMGGPLGEAGVQDIIWDKMHETPATSRWQQFFRLGEDRSDYWHRSVHDSLFPQPTMEEYLERGKAPPMVRRHLRRLLFAITLAGSIWGAHNPRTVYESPFVQWPIYAGEKAADGISHGLEYVSETVSRLWNGAPSEEEIKEKAERKRREQIERQAQEEAERTNREPFDPQNIPDQRRSADPEKPQQAHNKDTLGKNGPAKSQSIAYQITKKGSITDAEIPSEFVLGYVADLEGQKTVEVPAHRYYDSDKAYEVTTPPGQFHIPTKGVIFLPRAHSNVPVRVEVTTPLDGTTGHGTKGSTDSYSPYGYGAYNQNKRRLSTKTFLTEKGQLYIQLPEGDEKRPVQVKVTYDLSRIQEKEAQAPAFDNLDATRLLGVNQKLRDAGLTVMADALDREVTGRQSAGQSISLHDLEAAFRSGARYSDQPGALDTTLDVADLRRLKGFQNNGNDGLIYYQCDGALSLLETYLANYFPKEAGAELELARLLVREPGSEFLMNDAYHAQMHVRLKGQRPYVKLDITPSQRDPRDPKPKDKLPPAFVQARDQEIVKEELERAAAAETESQKKQAEEEKKAEQERLAKNEAPKATEEAKPEAPKATEEPQGKPHAEEGKSEPAKAETHSEEKTAQPQKPEPPPSEEKTQTAKTSEPVDPWAAFKKHPWFYNPWHHRTHDSWSFLRRWLAFAGLMPDHDEEGRRWLREAGLLDEEEEKKEEPKPEIKKAEAPKPKPVEVVPPKPELPPPPPELLRIVRAKHALQDVVEDQKVNFVRNSKLPQVDTLLVAQAAEKFLSTGKGLDELVARLHEGAGQSTVKVENAGDVRAAIVRLQQEQARRKRAHADRVLRDEAVNHLDAHGLVVGERLDAVFSALRDYPWEKAPGIAEQLAEIAAHPPEAFPSASACAERMFRLSPAAMYKLPIRPKKKPPQPEFAGSR